MLRPLPTVSDAQPIDRVQLRASTEGVEAAAGLASSVAASARQLREDIQPELDARFEQMAEEDVAAAVEARGSEGEGLSIRARNLHGRARQVYDNALEAGVVARSGTDAARIITRIGNEFRHDLGGFDAASASALSEYLSAVPTSLAAEVEAEFARHITSEYGRIADRQATLALQEADLDIARDLDRLIRDRDMLFSDLGENAVFDQRYMDIRDRYSNLVSVRVDNDALPYGDGYMTEMMDAFDQGAMREAVRRSVLATEERAGTFAALDELQDAIDDIPATAEERAQMYNSIAAELSQRQTLQSIARADAERAREQATREAAAQADLLMARVVNGEMSLEEAWPQAREYIAMPGNVLTSARWQSVRDNRMRGGSATVSEDHLPTYSSLNSMISNPDVSRAEFFASLSSALEQGQLRQETYRSLEEQWDTELTGRLRDLNRTVDAFFGFTEFGMAGTDNPPDPVLADQVKGELRALARSEAGQAMDVPQLEAELGRMLRRYQSTDQEVIPPALDDFVSGGVMVVGPSGERQSVIINSHEDVTPEVMRAIQDAILEQYEDSPEDLRFFARQLREMEASADAQRRQSQLIERLGQGAAQ